MPDDLVLKLEGELRKLGVDKDTLATLRAGGKVEDKDATIKTLRGKVRELEHELSARMQLVKAMTYQKQKAREARAWAEKTVELKEAERVRSERVALGRVHARASIRLLMHPRSC